MDTATHIYSYGYITTYLQVLSAAAGNMAPATPAWRQMMACLPQPAASSHASEADADAVVEDPAPGAATTCMQSKRR